MKLLFSAFTGYNLRELLLPLSPLLLNDGAIKEVLVVTPAASHHQELLPDLTGKYTFLDQLPDQESYEKLLQQYRPDLVITPTAGLEPRDIPLLNAAKAAGIPTLTFVASWDNVYKMERRMKLKKYRGQYALADHFAVWNTMNRDHLLKIVPSLTPERVTITGAPRLDFLANPAALPPRAELLKYLGLPVDNKKIIHLATTELYSSDYLVQTLSGSSNPILKNNFNLLVSVHPGGNLSTHQAYADPHGAHVFYSFGRRERVPVPDFLYSPTLAQIRLHAALFYHSDLLINHSSTVTIESLIAGRPVINVKYGRPYDWWHWYTSMVYRDFKQHAKIIIDSGATAVVKSERALLAAASAYLSDPHRDETARQALAKTMTTTDGAAGSRLLDLIKNIATVKPLL